MKQAYGDWYEYFTALNAVRLSIFEKQLNSYMETKHLENTEESQLQILE